MKIYFYVTVYQVDNSEPYDIITKYPEIKQFPESYQHWQIDTKFVRKMKLSALENGDKYSDIVNLLHNSDLITILKHKPTFSTSGMSGASGVAGASGTDGGSNILFGMSDDEMTKFLNVTLGNCDNIGVSGCSGTSGVIGTSGGNKKQKMYEN